MTMTITELQAALAYERSARQKAEQQIAEMTAQAEHRDLVIKQQSERCAELLSYTRADSRQLEYMYREHAELQLKFEKKSEKNRVLNAKLKKLKEAADRTV